MEAAKMDCVTTMKIFCFKRRNRDRFGLELGKRLSQPREVASVSYDRQIGVKAKLGCAVQYACLSAHEQCPD